MLSLPIYMDHHATTPVDPRVVEAMVPFFTDTFGNPSSRHHAFGWAARDAVAAARRQVADLIGADPREIHFTSGATESDNLAVRGVATAEPRRPLHVVTMTTEHHAVLDPCRRLEREGVEVSRVEPRGDGTCDVADIERALRPETRLVSVMMANNEIGVLQPIAEIAALTRPRGILLHTDAAQAVGKVPVDVGGLGVDLLSLTAHKMCGPKGIGALYVRRCRPRLAIAPLFDGGGHEQGLRSGTLNVPGIVGLGAAAALCGDDLAPEARRVGALRNRLLDGLRARLDGVTINGSLAARLPHNLNVSFDGLEGRVAARRPRRRGGLVGRGMHVGESGAVARPARHRRPRSSGPRVAALRARPDDDGDGGRLRHREGEQPRAAAARALPRRRRALTARERSGSDRLGLLSDDRSDRRGGKTNSRRDGQRGAGRRGVFASASRRAAAPASATSSSGRRRARPGDEVFDAGHEMKIFVDPKSYRYLRGTVLDCDPNMLGQSLVFRNPNAKSACGCGLSFEI